MAIHKRGKQSFVLPQLPVIQTWASVAGKKESEGPLAHTFDKTSQDTYFGQKTWEQAEKHMQQQALDILSEKAGMKKKDFDLVLSGDLLNQCIGSSFSLRNTGIPHLGLYGACSTMAESLLLASVVAVSAIRSWLKLPPILPPRSVSTASPSVTADSGLPLPNGPLPVPEPRWSVPPVQGQGSSAVPWVQSLTWESRMPTTWALPWPR